MLKLNRLTERTPDGYIIKGTTLRSETIDRLGAYEDSELEPQEVIALKEHVEQLEFEVEKYKSRFYDADNLYNSIPLKILSGKMNES